MTGISGAEPYLIEDHFCCRRGEWIIVVGYPLTQEFQVDRLEKLLTGIVNTFNPITISLIAPKLPASLPGFPAESQSDDYYTLDLDSGPRPARLIRLAARAREELTVDGTGEFGRAHQEITQEFLNRVELPRRVANLFLKMPNYVGSSSDAVVLNAWDRQHRLVAYYVVDLAAEHFSNYVIGCHSKRNYVKGASDLLFLEMIELSREHAKRFIHLGLGVNEGIRRFKKKWGGKATLKYEMCEVVRRKSSLLQTVLRYFLTK